VRAITDGMSLASTIGSRVLSVWAAVHDSELPGPGLAIQLCCTLHTPSTNVELVIMSDLVDACSCSGVI
jgi:hypothetical protein